MSEKHEIIRRIYKFNRIHRTSRNFSRQLVHKMKLLPGKNSKMKWWNKCAQTKGKNTFNKNTSQLVEIIIFFISLRNPVHAYVLTEISI